MKTLIKIATALLVWATAYSAEASVIYQSAALGPRSPNCCGFVSIFSGNYSGTNNPQWLGAAFTITSPTDVTGIGGLIGLTEGQLFGAIVNLGSNGLPSGSPFAPGKLVFETLLSKLPGNDNLTVDYVQPVSVQLNPGRYGLIFGAGAFGATTGFGGMSQGLPNGPGDLDFPQASYFFYGNQGQFPGGPIWQQAGFTSTRFVVYGSVVTPAPPSWILFLTGFAGIGFAGCRLAKKRSVTLTGA